MKLFNCDLCFLDEWSLCDPGKIIFKYVQSAFRLKQTSGAAFVLAEEGSCIWRTSNFHINYLSVFEGFSLHCDLTDRLSAHQLCAEFVAFRLGERSCRCHP